MQTDPILVTAQSHNITSVTNPALGLYCLTPSAPITPGHVPGPSLPRRRDRTAPSCTRPSQTQEAVARQEPWGCARSSSRRARHRTGPRPGTSPSWWSSRRSPPQEGEGGRAPPLCGASVFGDFASGSGSTIPLGSMRGPRPAPCTACRSRGRPRAPGRRRHGEGGARRARGHLPRHLGVGARRAADDPRHVNVYVNGELAREETAVADGDRIHVLPAITGG